MLDFKIIVYALVCILIIYIVYEFDNIIHLTGFPSNKIQLRDLNGYYYDESVNMHNLLKPKIFIHVPYEKNSRNWESFGSRTSEDLNLSIVYLCIKSIIEHCGYKYDIILFDNNNIQEILEKYNLHDECSNREHQTLNNIQLKYWQSYCKAKILYHFGGTMMSPYFYFNKCPSSKFLKSNALHGLYYVNEGLKNTNEQLVASMDHYMVSNKHNSDLNVYLSYLKELCLGDHIADASKYDKVYKHLEKLNLYDPRDFCITNKNNEPIFYDDWLSANKELNLLPSHFAVYINVDLHKQQTKNGWFLKMNPQQIMDSNTIIGQYLKIYEK